MTLRYKTLLLFGFILVALISTLGFLAFNVVMDGFKEVEKKDTLSNVERVVEALSSEVNTVTYTCRDWAEWSDTYNYVADKNEEYASTNLNNETIARLALNYMIYYSTTGEIVSKKGFDLKNESIVEIPDNKIKLLFEKYPQLRAELPKEGIKGYALLPDGPMMIAARPILKSDGTGPSHGNLIFGRFLFKDELKKLAGQTHLDLDLYRADRKNLPQDIDTSASMLTAASPIAIVPISQDIISGVSLLQDISGNPFAYVRIDMPRDITKQGKASLMYFIFFLTVAGIVFCAVALFLLEKMVLSRLNKLQKGILQVREKGDLSLRIPVEGRDEMAHFAEAFNRMMEALQQSRKLLNKTEEKIQILIRATNDAIWDWDLTTNLVEWNEGITTLFGYSQKQVGKEAQWWTDNIHPNDQLRVLKGIHSAIDGGETVWSDEYRFKRADGTFSHVVDRGFIMHDATGKAIRMIGAMIDVSKRKQAEEALKKSEEQMQQFLKMEAIGRLAGGVAHDFNNMMTAVIGHSEMILDQIKPDNPFYREIQEIKKSGERAAALTSKLLAFGRKQILKPAAVNMNTVLGEMQLMLRRLVREDIEIVNELNTSIDDAVVDPTQIEQVVMNLAVNARDAMPKGGRLLFQTRQEKLDAAKLQGRADLKPGNYVVLRIEDTGHGMDPEVMRHIFEPYFTTKEKGKGMGLGLSIVHGIVMQSGGLIVFDSKKGKGTFFEIYFPATRRKRAETPISPISSVPGGTETILLVEDEEAVRSMAKDILELRGYHVLPACDGMEALNCFRANGKEIDLMLTDVIMPKMSGPELAKRIHQLSPTVKVIFMSGYTDDEMTQHGIFDSDYCFISKPFSPSNLAQKIRDILDSPLDPHSKSA